MKKRGKRGSVVFDECGFLDEEMMSVYAAFAIVNKSLNLVKIEMETQLIETDFVVFLVIS